MTEAATQTAQETHSLRAQAKAELDEVTLLRAQRGDMTAKKALVERYQRPVFALISRMLRTHCDRATIEDIAQDSFLKVFRALPSFDRNGSARLSTWILTITSRRCIDELRRGGRTPAPHPHEADALPGHTRTDELAERQRLARQIDDAVAALPPEYKAAFLLREIHELDYAEIATALEIDLGTVKSRLNRARRRLRAALAEVYDER